MFVSAELVQVSREANSRADALAKLATIGECDLSGQTPVKILTQPSIQLGEELHGEN